MVVWSVQQFGIASNFNLGNSAGKTVREQNTKRVVRFFQIPFTMIAATGYELYMAPIEFLF